MADEPKVRSITTKKSFDSNTAPPSLSVVMFSAPWCSACQNLKPEYYELPAKVAPVRFFEINSDKGVGSDIADSFDVQALPTVIFFRNGKQLNSLRGPSVHDITAMCNKLQ